MSVQTQKSQDLATMAAAAALQKVNADGQMLQMATDAITNQQAMIINAFRGQIYISDTLDVQDTPIYDTFTAAAAFTITTGNSQFFSNVEQPGSGKTFAQTNLSQNRKLDAPQAFSVLGIRLGFSENLLESDALTFMNSWAYEFWLGEKWYQRATPRHFSSGWGLTGFSTKTSDSLLTNGYPSRGSMNLLDIKLVIANQMSFYAQLTGSAGQVLAAGGTGLILVNECVGYFARGVQ